MPHILSKSTFMYGCQCAKRLCLHKFKPELRNPMDEKQEAIFGSGTDVGLLARNLFPGGIDAAPPDSYSFHLSVAKTKMLIESGTRIIYEAAFENDGLLCAIDILENKDGRWYAYEVKGSSDVKEQFVTDAAFQYYVITSSGIALADISIIHLNREYVRYGVLNIQQLFKIESVREKAIVMIPKIAQKATELKAIVAAKEIPPVDIGAHCFTPYGCDFSNYCWSHVPDDSVFDLRGNLNGLQYELYKKGIVKLLDVPIETILPKGAAFQLDHYLSGDQYLDKNALNEFLKPFSYPLWFLDFETYMVAVPEFDYTSPWQQIPFQYSLHLIRSETSTPEHFEFLADPSMDPRESFIQNLLSHLGEAGSIIAYNATFEKTQMKNIATDFPQYAKSIERTFLRFVDLMLPFRSRYYYHPEFKGSYSLKDVLPVMVPELSYDDLEVHEGGMASLTFLKMREEKDAVINEQHRKNLLEYCKMDTMAMLRIFEKLNLMR